MDADDDLDLLVGGTNPTGRQISNGQQTVTYYDGVLRVFRNDGLGMLVDSAVPLLGSAPYPIMDKGLRYGVVSLNDLEGDDDIDLLINGLYADLLAANDIYRNSGVGTFLPLGLAYSMRAFPYNSWGHIDNDGRPDIMMGDELATHMYRNLGGGNFSVLTNLPGNINGSAAWIDIDNDADNDFFLILADYRGFPGRSHVYQNDGAGNLADTGILLPNLELSSIAPADFDGDGWIDFVLSGTSNSLNNAVGATTQLYRNENGVHFRRVEVPFVPVYQAALSWADYNNDGHTDLLIAGKGTNGLPITRLYRNQLGTFIEDNVGLPDLATPAIAWGDNDADGDLDLAISGSTSNGLFSGLFVNNNSASNIRPFSPGELWSVLMPDNGVLLTWGPGSDSETTNTALLTYSARVGTNSGGQQLVASLSNPSNGVRRVVQFGQRHRSLHLPDLPRGEYFWSVQTIDTAFVGSPFAPEARFAITNTRPTISSLPELRAIPQTLATNATFNINDFETPAQDLVLSATSSDTNLLPLANIFFGGTGSNRTIVVQPTSLVGTSIVTITVRDADDGRRSSSFAVRVLEFSEVAGLFPYLNFRNFAWGDYDQDGDPDLLAVGTRSGTNFMKLYRNDRDDTFIEVDAHLPASGPGAVLWSDFDNDGYLDILLTGTNGSWVLQNLKDNTFVDRQLGLPAVSGSSAVAFDYDNDGDKDLLISGFQSGRGSIARLYRNDAGWKFSNVPVAPVAVTAGTIATGDLDNDGDIDLLASGQIQNAAGSSLAVFTRFFRNDGNGNFSLVGPTLPSIARSAALGDYDSDGDLDILLNLDNGLQQSRPFLFRNGGNWTFSEVAAGLPAFDRGTAAWGDYDNDGHLDILLTGRLGGSFSSSGVCRNNGFGTFDEILALLQDVGFGASSWIDYDNDGRLDVTTSGNSLRLIRNLYPSTSPTPPQPTNLQSTVLSGGSVVLWWDHGPSTPGSSTAAVGYNLQVGSSSKGEEIMSPSSDPSTGYRRLGSLGNAATTNSWKLNLPPGTYYWRVQSIGANLAGSEFSTEQSFSIVAPVIESFLPSHNNGFHLRFMGSTALSYSVMMSSDLTNWSLLGPASETLPGVFEFSLTNAVSSPGFIRIRTP